MGLTSLVSAWNNLGLVHNFIGSGGIITFNYSLFYIQLICQSNLGIYMWCILDATWSYSSNFDMGSSDGV